MKKGIAAVGGTFDRLHLGHKTLILEAFRLGKTVVLGVTSDRFAEMEGKLGVAPFAERRGRILDFLVTMGLADKTTIVKLDDSFGPILEPRITHVVVTKDTRATAVEANRLRADRGIPPMKIRMVRMVLAKDGIPISSSRIRDGDIDGDGNLTGS